MDTTQQTLSKSPNLVIRRGLWFVGFIVAAGIGITGFSILSSFLVA